MVKRKFVWVLFLVLFCGMFVFIAPTVKASPSISYSAGVITVLAEDVTFWDLWNASDTNGWGVVHNNNETNIQFQFDARIALGDGTSGNKAWLNDTNVQITFSSLATTGTWQELILVKHHSGVNFGAIEDLTSRKTSQGVNFIIQTDYASCSVIFGQSYAYIGVYSCSFTVTEQDHWVVYSTAVSARYTRVWNSLFDQNSILRIQSPDAGDLYNIIAQKGSTSLFVAGTQFNFAERIFITDYLQLFDIGSSYSMSLQDVYARGLTRLGYIGNGWTGNVNLTNTDSNIWAFTFSGTSTGEIYRQYEFDLTVTNSTNYPIENANVTVTYEGQGGGTVGSWLTDSNGQIPQQTLTQGFYNQTGGDTIYSYNPYNITISKTGYFTYTQLFTLNDKKAWQIALLVPQASVTYTSAILVAVAFLVVPLVAVMFIVWRRH